MTTAQKDPRRFPDDLNTLCGKTVYVCAVNLQLAPGRVKKIDHAFSVSVESVQRNTGGRDFDANPVPTLQLVETTVVGFTYNAVKGVTSYTVRWWLDGVGSRSWEKAVQPEGLFFSVAAANRQVKKTAESFADSPLISVFKTMAPTPV